MIGYIDTFPSKNLNIKELLIHKTHTVNSEFAILSSGNINNELNIFVQNICLNIDGIIFTSKNSSINGSNSNQFLDKKLNLILDNLGNSEITDLQVVINSQYY